jgi:hypothetical protein
VLVSKVLRGDKLNAAFLSVLFLVDKLSKLRVKLLYRSVGNWELL